MAHVVFNGAEDPSPGRASHRAAPSPDEAQPLRDATWPHDERHREEGKEGSRGTLGPDGSRAQENLVAEQLPSGEAPDGYITNRPPSKTNTGGEDWFEVSLYLGFVNFDRLRKQLDAARAAAEDGRQGEDELTFGGVKFLVQPSGAGAGTSHKRIYFRWQLHCENGLVIQLMNREYPHRTMPNGKVRATSVLSMQLGAERVWELALSLLRSMGCIVERNKLSRVDPCVDLPEASIASFCDPCEAGHYVTRARASSKFEYEDHVVATDGATHSFGRRPTGFTLGQGSLKLRIYDKVREASLTPEKIAAVVGCRWGYWTPTASRVEFRVRRETLKELGVDTVADWFAKRAEVCEYLCTQWFRLTSGPVDRDHADRSETLAVWLAVQRAFAAWAGKPDYICLQPLVTEECLPTNLIQQVVGLFVSYFARTGTRIDDNVAFLDQGMEKVAKLIRPRDMASEIERKALELGLRPAPFKEFESPS